MAAFSYKALDARGKTREGMLDADTAKMARQQLREQGLTPLSVAETMATAQRHTNSRQNWLSPHISTADLALITRQMATLVAAALPLEEALRAVSQQSDKSKLQTLLSAVRSKVLEGHSLADSMAHFPTVFDDLYRAMVAAGEKSGHLDVILNRLADYTEQRQHMKNKLIQALIYPIILTLVAIGVISLLLTAVVPKIVEQFIHMKQTLPLSTRILMGSSDFLRDYGLGIVIVLGLLMLGWHQWLKNKEHLRRYHAILLRLPVIGRVSRGLNTARFARTLSILNASAVPLLDGMQISGEVLSNNEAKRRVTQATERVREGSSLSQSLDKTGLFPPMMLHMIASGERSGELDNMLERAADNQDREFESQINIALSVFEPVLVVSMAVIVLFIVLAVLQPILQLNNMVGQ